MSADESITGWIDKVKDGSEDAAAVLWERYFPQLVSVARNKLAGQRRRIADEEDVVLSVMESFFRAAEEDRFPNLNDREGLWRLLSEMTRRKAVDLIRHNERQKRQVQGESVMGGFDSESGEQGFARISGDDLTPEIATALTEDCQRLLELLDPNLRDLALKKLDGFTNKEIAEDMECSVPTVERRLALIRKIWKPALQE